MKNSWKYPENTVEKPCKNPEKNRAKTVLKAKVTWFCKVFYHGFSTYLSGICHEHKNCVKTVPVL